MNINEHFSIVEQWDKISAAYQRRRALPTDVISLGAQVDDALGGALLDDLLAGGVRGKRILDLGCGGGQNCIALAKMGAEVAGVDSSLAQVDFARALAAQHGVGIPFYCADIADLGALADGTWEVALAVATLHYLPNPQDALAEAARALAPGGCLVASVDHPVRTLFFDTEDAGDAQMTTYPVRDYFTPQSVDWRYPETAVIMRTWHHTVAQWVGMVQASGLALRRVLEPPTPADLLDALWPEDDALAPLRLIPHTLIFVATKPD